MNTADPGLFPAPCPALPAAEFPEVSLLIPTTNQVHALEACLRSLALHLPATVACEVIVVLNAATAGIEALTAGCAGLRVARSAANLGVAGGYNLARSLARGRFLVLLHDDVEIGPGWLEPLLATAAACPHAGAIGSRVLNPDGSPQRAGSLLYRNGLTRPAPPLDRPGPWPVDYTGTCATLVPTAWWDALGGMDEALYPAYYVDVDLCTRLQELGALVLCEPASQLLHHSGSSTSSEFKTLLTRRNQALFCAKHASLLTDYEPWAPDDPEAIPRARLRTFDRAARLASQAPPAPHAPPPVFDPAAQQIRHFQMDLALHKAWSGRLADDLAATRAQLAAVSSRVTLLKQKLTGKDQQITQLKARCQALKSKAKRPSFLHRISLNVRQLLIGRKK